VSRITIKSSDASQLDVLKNRKRKKKEENETKKIKATFLLLTLVSILVTSLSIFPVFGQSGPKTPNMIIHIYLNPDAENADMDAGVLDINDSPLPKAWIDAWRDNPDIQMTCDWEMGEAEFDINNQKWPTGCEDHKFFDDTCPRCLAARDFRKAIAHFTDKDRYITEILEGYGYVADTKLPLNLMAYMADLRARN